MKAIARFIRSKYVGRIIWLRSFAYSLVCNAFGKRSRILGKISVISPEKITVGENVAINGGCLLNARGGITIGNHVNISPGVLINTGGLDYTQKGEERLHFWGSVVIHDGVWIGAGAIINPNVEIGKNSVIGAGSVVTKNIPANTVAVGVPARVIKEIP